MLALRGLALAATLLILACGDGDVVTDAAAVDGPTVPLVTGRVGLIHPGGIFEPMDISDEGTIQVCAIVEVAPLQFETYIGYGLADGTFAIEGVPVGPYLLGFKTSEGWPFYVATRQRFVDLSQQSSFPADAVYANELSAGLTLTVAGLSPWTDADELQLYSPDIGMSAAELWWFSPSMSPEIGATGFSLQTTFWPFPLLDTGDHAYLAQAVAPLGFPNRLVLYGVGELSPVAMAEGTFPAASVTITALPTTHIDIAWQPASFTAFSDALLPGAATKDFGVYARNDHVVLFRDRDPGDVDTVLSFDFGQPPGDGDVVTAALALLPDYGLHHGYLSVTLPVSAVQGGTPLVPLIGPVQQPRLNGVDAFLPHADVGLTPTLTWAAPSFGVPVRYHVELTRLYGGGGFTFVTEDRALTIPPGVLALGITYVAQISAMSGVDPTYPRSWRTVAPWGWAMLATEEFSP